MDVEMPSSALPVTEAPSQSEEWTAQAYQDACETLIREDREHSWDEQARLRASSSERRAARIVTTLRENERKDVFGDMPGESLPGAGTRDMGGRFLLNKSKIEGSEIFRIAQKLPKGCHLHVHFNAEMPPSELLVKARSLPDTLFVHSSTRLLTEKDFADAEITFKVQRVDTESTDVLSSSYDPEAESWMKWTFFRESFPGWLKIKCLSPQLDRAESWAAEKILITAEKAYHVNQTHNGIWACFNMGTRAFKGLLHSEGVFRWYIAEAIDRMVNDGILYTEWRTMLSDKAIPTDDGLGTLDLTAQMSIIDEIATQKKSLWGKRFPFGVKMISCAPRSIPLDEMEKQLNTCIDLKRRFPHLICGFDLVGAEDRPNPISHYLGPLLSFRRTCIAENLSIPFLFHAGETHLDTGGTSSPSSSNLYDALLLGSKRIGHGYALPRHTTLLKKYKQRGIGVEVCPISNELLHLCANVREHVVFGLLAAGVECCVNADNPSVFQSTLSHDFYQILVGSPAMDLHGWRQLVEWSVKHSCLDEEQKSEAYAILDAAWRDFCAWIEGVYGFVLDDEDDDEDDDDDAEEGGKGQEEGEGEEAGGVEVVG